MEGHGMEVCSMVALLLSAPTDLMTLLQDINPISPRRHHRFHVNAHDGWSKNCQQRRPPRQLSTRSVDQLPALSPISAAQLPDDSDNELRWWPPTLTATSSRPDLYTLASLHGSVHWHLHCTCEAIRHVLEVYPCTGWRTLRFSKNPYPYPLQPVPLGTGMGFPGYGCG